MLSTEPAPVQASGQLVEGLRHPGPVPTETQPSGWAQPVATTLASAAFLSACGGGSTTGAVSASDIPGVNPADFSYPSAANDGDAARFLQQAQFSSTSAEIAGLRGGTYAAWLGRQFTQAQGPSAWDWMESRGYGAVDANKYYQSTGLGDNMVWSQLLSGPDAVRRRCALALSELFVVSLQTSSFNWRGHAFAHYWDTLVRNAFGNFRQLLEDVTLHPVMGYFLNTRGNLKEDPKKGRVPDENYAREVMQLFTIGLYKLNLDGSTQTDGQGQPIETYSQDDVSNLARVFTGYNFDTSDGVRLPVPDSSSTIESKDFARKPMSLDPSKHSTLEAVFLGATVPAGTPGAAALKIALDTLFNHPNVGPFFARQMIQRLVTSEPSAAYVARVAARFNNNGLGVRGDLRAVWAGILLDDEARDPKAPANTRFGKLREPMLRLAQWARTFGVNSTEGSWKVSDLSNPADRLGQSPLRSPSVFNFFRPGYVPPGTALADAQASAPEFQLVNESSVGGYLNYMQTVLRSGISSDMKAAYTKELELVTDARALVAHLSVVLCADQLSAATQTLMVDALNTRPVTSASSENNKLDRIAGAVLMVMASAEYLVQK
ncbi:DUF1800 family protein [Hydrogenophaga sp.]|uniref:DUF1800 domain-containing protein n=1 Tax=Hydrogenophaga sp. TaxID=1904254 RepID=UPI003562A87E